jgi:hypothetical protein
MNTLKAICNVFDKDIATENFTKREFVIFGIKVPLALIAACVLADYLFNR